MTLRVDRLRLGVVGRVRVPLSGRPGGPPWPRTIVHRSTVPPVPVTDFHEETARGMKVERPGRISSTIALVEAGLRPTRAARQLEWESRHPQIRRNPDAHKLHKLVMRTGRVFSTRSAAEYYEAIISTLSRQLTAEYGRGYDRPNLYHMICFAEVFPDEAIVNALRTQLSWTHFRALLAIDDNTEARILREDVPSRTLEYPHAPTQDRPFLVRTDGREQQTR